MGELEDRAIEIIEFEMQKKKWVDKEGGSGVGTDVHPWRIHADEWQKPLQYCKVKKQIKLEKKK